MGKYDIVTAGDPDLAELFAAAGMDDMELANSGYTAIMGGAEDQAMQRLRAQLLAKNSLLTERKRPSEAREYPLGFEALNVLSGAQVDVVAQPQVVYKPRRLIVPSDIAGQFLLNQIRVGKNSQLAGSAGIPARTFDEQGVGVNLGLDTAQISQQIVLTVTNIGGAAADFRATFIGDALEY